MTHYVLDTDQMTLWQRSHPVVTQQIKAVGQENVGITIITVEEQVRGWLAEVRKASQSFQATRLSWAYAGLRDAVQSFGDLHPRVEDTYSPSLG